MNPKPAAGGSAPPRHATSGGPYARRQYPHRNPSVNATAPATPLAELLPLGLLGALAPTPTGLREGSAVRMEAPGGYNITATRLAEPTAADFICPDPTGGPDAPCFRRLQRNPIGLEIECADRVDYCPVAATSQCVPYQEWLPFREQKLTDLARAAGVPARLAAASFDTATRTDVIRRAMAYAHDDLFAGRALALLGATGVGKSFAAVAVLRHYHGHRRSPGAFAFLPELVTALVDRETRSDTLTRMKMIRCLVLDDIGSEYRPDGGLADALIDEILVTREAEHRATVLTSNCTAAQLRTKLSDRVLDRLAGEWGAVYAVPGPSLRRPPA